MQVRLDKDTITPELKRIMGEVKRPIVLFQAGAKAVQVAISKHLRDLQARGNEHGWPDRHFFSGSATAVEKNVGIARVDDKGAEVTIADPRFIHRITGGVVTPKRVKFLAIPLTAKAYMLGGKGSLREAAPGLKVARVPGLGLCLVSEDKERHKNGRIKKGGKIVVVPMFRLVKSVKHSPHPDEMPDSEKLGEAARKAMMTAARLMLKAE